MRGLGLACLLLVIWLVVFSIFKLLLLMLAVTRFLLILVVVTVFVVGLCLMSMAPCSSLILLMFEKEIRLCLEASWLGVSGMVFFLVVFVVRSFHVGFLERQMGVVICFDSVPFLLLLRFAKILNFMISSEWIRDIGLVVYSGTVGFLVSLVSMEPPLGLLMLLIVPVTLLNLRLAVTILVFLLRGALLLILMLLRLPLCCLILLMFGPMVALFLIGLLVCPLLVPGFLLISLFPAGIIGVGVMLIRFARLVIFSVVRVFVLFLGLCSPFRELSYGVLFLHYSPLVLSTLVLIIWVLFVMLMGCLMVAVALSL